MEEVFTNRDIAVILWVTVFFTFAMTKADVRSSVQDIVVQFFNPKLSIPLLFSAIPAALIIVIFHHYGLWNAVMTKTAIVWAIGTGFVSFLNTGKHNDGRELFLKSTKEALRFTVILEFLINFYVFPLYIELVFVPFVTILVLLSTFAGVMHDKTRETELARKLFDGLLTAIGFGLIIYVVVQFINAPAQLFTAQNLEELLLPILLTFTYIPTIYALAVYSSYEQLFIRLKLQIKKNDMKLKWLCVRKAKLSLKRINELSQHLFKRIYTQEKPNIEKIINSYK